MIIVRLISYLSLSNIHNVDWTTAALPESPDLGLSTSCFRISFDLVENLMAARLRDDPFSKTDDGSINSISTPTCTFAPVSCLNTFTVVSPMGGVNFRTCVISSSALNVLQLAETSRDDHATVVSGTILRRM